MEPTAQGRRVSPIPATAHHGVRDLKDQCPGTVVGKAGSVEEVAGGSKVNHAFVIRGEAQRQWRERDSGAVGQGEELALGGARGVKQEVPEPVPTHLQ